MLRVAEILFVSIPSDSQCGGFLVLKFNDRVNLTASLMIYFPVSPSPPET